VDCISKVQVVVVDQIFFILHIGVGQAYVQFPLQFHCFAGAYNVRRLLVNMLRNCVCCAKNGTLSSKNSS